MMERIGLDRFDDLTKPCQEYLDYKYVISCPVKPLLKSHYTLIQEYSNNRPLYKRHNDGSGEPYTNIMELHARKIHNCFSERDYKDIANVWVVQYKYLLNYKGTQELVDQVAKRTGVEPEYKPVKRKW
jgi:hypothetical protein